MSNPVASFFAANEQDTLLLAQDLAQAALAGLPNSLVVYLEGDLGAGKTTFSRYFIQACGHEGRVKSPTYTLVEPYELEHLTVYHFDLYRLADPEELEYMGMRDYFAGSTFCLIEWAEKGGQGLAAADLVITINTVSEGRRFEVAATSAKGTDLLRLCKRI